MNRRKTWRIGFLIAVILLAGIMVVLVYCNARVQNFNTYFQDLERMIDAMVFLNAPIADIFASGEELEVAVMNTAQMRIGQLLREFEALGRPPEKLAEAYEALKEALTSFKLAYNLLKNALELQSTNLFDAHFLESAHGAGAAIHRAYAALPAIQAQSCSDL